MKKSNVNEKMTPIPVHSKKLKPRDDINHNNNNVKKSRFLITVNVLGSAGPIRFLVTGNDLVASVIDTALKTFAREGRLPVLGFDVDKFLLYCANEGSDGIVTNLFFLINFFFHFSGEFYYSRFLIDFNPFCNEYNQWCPNAFLFLFLFLSFTLGLRVNFGLPLRKRQSLIYSKLL